MLSEILFLLEKYLTKEVQLRQVSKEVKSSYEMYMKRISLYVDDIKLAKYFTNQRIKINFKGMDYINLNIDFIHTLDLNHTKVTDVSILGNVHTLDLNHTKVTDVSILGKVYTLDLSWTKNKRCVYVGECTYIRS